MHACAEADAAEHTQANPPVQIQTKPHRNNDSLKLEKRKNVELPEDDVNIVVDCCVERAFDGAKANHCRQQRHNTEAAQTTKTSNTENQQ